MKRTVVLYLATLSTFVAVQITKASVIADWTFETSVPTNAGPFSPEIGSGSASGSHAGAAVYSSPSGDGSTHSFSSTLWAVGDYYQFQVSTLNFTNVMLSFEEVSSGTGPSSFNLEYSLTGSSFTTFTSYTVTNSPSWSPTTGPFSDSSFSFDLSSITALANASTVYIRLVDANNAVDAAGTAAVGTGGTDRVDDFIVSATALPVPEPSALLLSTLGGIALLALRRRR
jgi:hypothetical protein